ncbi:AraC family transcriptional regulator [Blautia sp. HCP3S3_H10_1]|uniref:AraC family transcriptional regulator n=1 Tax=unclassified Blautia TaxID=2648079 RepID=UPI003F93257A|nr:AraC family transcriptional regulator [Clostridia bacterium]
MGQFNDLSERTVYIRKHYINIPQQYDYDDLPLYETKGALSSASCRRVTDNLSSLLVVYRSDGTEWSISPTGRRLVHRDFPRLSWFHKHDYVEIFYVIEGSFTQVLFGEKIRFEQGEFVITDRNCEHADYIEAKDAAVLFLQIQADYLEKLLRSYDGIDDHKQFLFHALWSQQKEQNFLELKQTQKFNADALLEQILDEDLTREVGHEQVKRGLMIRLLHHLCEDYTIQLHTDSKESREKAFLFELERYIQKHYATVTTTKLEEEFHYHRNYYHLLLKKYRGKTFQQYVTDIRMKYAQQLLEQTTLPVKQIANQAGYENISHFYHLFENYFGKTPSQIREETN